MVDAADLKSVASNGVRVQVPPRALFLKCSLRVWTNANNVILAITCESIGKNLNSQFNLDHELIGTCEQKKQK